MALVHGKVGRVMIDGYDFSGLCHNAEIDVGRSMAEITSYTDAGYNGLPGKSKGSFKLNGFYDTGLAIGYGGFDEQMQILLNQDTSSLVGDWPAGHATAGLIGYEIKAFSIKAPEKAAVGAAVMLDADFESIEAAVRSTLLLNGAVSAAGIVAGSNVNAGATLAAETFVATVRFVTYVGNGTLTVTVEHSNDDGAVDPYTLLATTGVITLVAGPPHVPQAVRLTVAGVSKAWKRVNVTTFVTLTNVNPLMVSVGKYPAS